MSDAGGDIIIKGGSVHLYYDEGRFQKDPSDPRKHSDSSKKIIRIKIMDGDKVVFDSGVHPVGLTWTTEVLCK